MTTPRRRIVRPAAASTSRPQADRRLAQLRTRLEKERLSLARWMRRLKRAFHSVERLQLRIARLERQMARCQS
ncbi:MAG: hypothetical protein ACYC3I_21550 [Gemmataceae bacterium]